MKENLEVIELIIKISKDLLFALLVIAIGIWIYKNYDIKMSEKLTLLNMFEASQHQNLSSKESIIVAANQTDEKQGSEDVAATGIQADAALAISTEAPGWVFIGTYKDGKLIDNSYFDVDTNELPTIGTFAIANVDLNKRASKPYRNDKNEWWKGKVIGLIAAGTKVQFLELAHDIPAKGGGIRLWARVLAANRAK